MHSSPVTTGEARLIYRDSRAERGSDGGYCELGDMRAEGLIQEPVAQKGVMQKEQDISKDILESLLRLVGLQGQERF